MRKQIFTAKGAEPKGPYSQAIVAAGPTVYVSGQGPVDPETGEFPASFASVASGSRPN